MARERARLCWQAGERATRNCRGSQLKPISDGCTYAVTECERQKEVAIFESCYSTLDILRDELLQSHLSPTGRGDMSLLWCHKLVTDDFLNLFHFPIFYASRDILRIFILWCRCFKNTYELFSFLLAREQSQLMAVEITYFLSLYKKVIWSTIERHLFLWWYIEKKNQITRDYERIVFFKFFTHRTRKVENL